MTESRAIRIALDLIRAEIKRLSPDAILHEAYGADYPAAKRASVRRAELRDAAALLALPRQTRMKL